MKSKPLIDALMRNMRVKTDKALCRQLDLSQMTLHNWRKRKKLTPRVLAQLISRLARRSLSGEAIVARTQKKLGATHVNALAKQLGISVQALNGWKRRRTVTTRQIAGLIATSKKASASSTHKSSIRPLVEFFPIAKARSKQSKNYSLFAERDSKDSAHPYLVGLKEELEEHHGVYVFFDSRGQAIYAGKARRQSLWRELNLALNRDRYALQKIRRVRHPSRKQAYQTSSEKARQIVESSVPLYELAAYFSAYDVADGMVDVVESLLVRSFANDLLNKRMERFGQ